MNMAAVEGFEPSASELTAPRARLVRLTASKVERAKGFEPFSPVWKTGARPLDQARSGARRHKRGRRNLNPELLNSPVV